MTAKHRVLVRIGKKRRVANTVRVKPLDRGRTVAAPEVRRGYPPVFRYVLPMRNRTLSAETFAPHCDTGLRKIVPLCTEN
jgi:hypothetical protein